MEKGDISNYVEPRLIVVFEGLLGILPIEKEKRALMLSRIGQWRRVVDLYEINDMLARHIWDQTRRYSRQVDVVTYSGVQFAEAVQAKLDDEMLPIGKVWHTEPHILSRSIAWRPDIAAIYDPDPQHLLTYGSKGRLLSPYKLGGFGS